MKLHPVLLASLLFVAAATPLAAQGIPPGARLGRQPSQLTRVMVATPFVFASADSATAVEVGQAMRERMGRVAQRSEYAVIPDSLMNSALEQFGYPKFSILNQALARTLAQQIAGRVLLTSTMAKDPSGRWSMVARLAGTNDDAGVTVRVPQRAGTPPTAMGVAAVDSLKTALDALDEARDCMNKRVQNPADAQKAAMDAIKIIPDHGLANYCLSQMASDTARRVQYLRKAVEGDSLSLIAMRQLAAIYEVQGDTAQTVSMLQNMLRAAPTDQELRQSAFRYFLTAGRSDAAIQVADEGLRRDSTNWDLWDLKSNACLFASDFRCAVNSLEMAYAMDSSRADTLFFAKVSASAEQQLSDSAAATSADTATFVRWAKIAARRYPENVTALNNLVKAYTYNREVDSTLVYGRRLLAIDSSNTTVALAVAQALFNANRPDEAMEFIGLVERNGDEVSKPQAAGLLVNGAVPLLQGDTAKYDVAGAMLRRAVALAPDAAFSPAANYLLGVADLQQVQKIDPETERQKSCALAREESTLIDEAGIALEKGAAYRPAESARLLEAVGQYKKRIATMVRSYCR